LSLSPLAINVGQPDFAAKRAARTLVNIPPRPNLPPPPAISNKLSSRARTVWNSFASGFERGDVVECVDIQGGRVAVGRVNFSSRSAELVKGLASDKVHQVLGEARSLEMIHRNHMAIY
jgi:hypothetical protein